MKQQTRGTIALVLVVVIPLVIAALTGCSTVPTVPQTVTVTVEKFKPLPAWATGARATRATATLASASRTGGTPRPKA